MRSLIGTSGLPGSISTHEASAVMDTASPWGAHHAAWVPVASFALWTSGGGRSLSPPREVPHPIASTAIAAASLGITTAMLRHLRVVDEDAADEVARVLLDRQVEHRHHLGGLDRDQAARPRLVQRAIVDEQVRADGEALER